MRFQPEFACQPKVGFSLRMFSYRLKHGLCKADGILGSTSDQLVHAFFVEQLTTGMGVDDVLLCGYGGV